MARGSISSQIRIFNNDYLDKDDDNDEIFYLCMGSTLLKRELNNGFMTAFFIYVL
jgi:hypothetical protein